MNSSIQTIPFANLALAFIPVIVVIAIIWTWKLDYKNSLVAVSRMLLQLLMIGYFLAYIFKSDSALVVAVVLTVMLFSSSWIALRTISIPRKTLFLKSFLAVFLGGSVILLIMTQAVLELNPWYLSSYMVPLAGMIFASSMTSISLAGERIEAEVKKNVPYEEAKNIAFQASMIPIVNSLLAVGLVSLPGMMTGQILSGVSPLIAVRYQVMVMCMIFGSSGISSAIFLVLIKSNLKTSKNATLADKSKE